MCQEITYRCDVWRLIEYTNLDGVIREYFDTLFDGDCLKAVGSELIKYISILSKPCKVLQHTPHTRRLQYRD